MIPQLYTFKKLIGSELQLSDDNVTQINDIIIPRIQRDYAQGRMEKSVNRVRRGFLDALYGSIQNQEAITLDFVYGDVEDGKLTLLDGQQRMTTLFLLHWYAAKKERIDRDRYGFLIHFSYATRFSSRDFCKALVEKEIKINCEKLSDEIKNQSWYPYDWKNDPTIQSMLVMIDAIQEKFENTDNLWDSLVENGIISFYFLPLKEMGLSDELYIKMNSRGKPLTDFEHFKAYFLEIVKEQNDDLYKELSRKIDIDWTDMLFPYRGDNQIIDDEFMRYFKFVSHILCYKNYNRVVRNNQQSVEYDEFKLAKQLYSKENILSISNLEFLKSAFDCWCNIDIDDFFKSIFYTEEYECGKTKLYLKGNETYNLFVDCCNYHSEFTENGRNRLFSLNNMLLFYAVLLYRQNVESISSTDFKRRIRIVRNLTENSRYEIREFDQNGNNQMQRLLSDIDEIIINGVVPTEDRGFNLLQKQEEKEKLEWLPENTAFKDALFQLEDHNLLKGTIAVVGLNNPVNFLKFNLLFDNCDKDIISRALLTIGDYSQNIGWRTQMGVKSKDTVWADLFHPTKQRNEGGRFQNTSTILNELLLKIPDDCNDVQHILETIVFNYLNNENTPFDWRYYFIKYEQMRFDTFGMYYWEDKDNKPYEVIIMGTEQRISGYNWNAFSYVLSKLHPDEFELDNYAYQGDRLRIRGKNISIGILNDRFVVYEEDKEPFDIAIDQDEKNVDVYDRIEKGMCVINSFLNKKTN